MRTLLLFTFLHILFYSDVLKAQPSIGKSDTDSITVSNTKGKEARLQLRYEKKLSRLKKKRNSLLENISTKDSLGLTKELTKLTGLNKEISALEKKLKLPKVNKDKLIGELTKEDRIDPYLKEYAKFKSIKKPTDIEGGVKTTNEVVLKNKEVDEVLKEVTLLKTLKLDSASLVSNAKGYGLVELNKQKEYKELKKELSPYINSPYLKGYTLKDLDSLSVDSLKSIAIETFNNLDKTLEKELSKQAEIKEFRMEMTKMKEFQNLPENYKKKFGKYSDKEYLKSEGVSKAVKEASKYLAEHQDKLTAAQSKLTKLKKKYSSVPNSNDLSTATKRNSLKGKPFKERMVIGGNVQLVSSDPLIIDISPVVGYKIDKQFRIAIGATYRARLTEYPQNSTIAPRGAKDELTYGYRAFGEYSFWKGFYVHAEYERMSREFEIKTTSQTPTDQYERKWVEAALLGIGKSYSINNKVKGSISLLYNFIYNTKEQVYPNPWVFRVGFELK